MYCKIMFEIWYSFFDLWMFKVEFCGNYSYVSNAITALSKALFWLGEFNESNNVGG